MLLAGLQRFALRTSNHGVLDRGQERGAVDGRESPELMSFDEEKQEHELTAVQDESKVRIKTERDTRLVRVLRRMAQHEMQFVQVVSV